MLAHSGAHQKALEAFQKCGNWRQMFCMAAQLNYSGQDRILLARNISGLYVFWLEFCSTNVFIFFSIMFVILAISPCLQCDIFSDVPLSIAFRLYCSGSSPGFFSRYLPCWKNIAKSYFKAPPVLSPPEYKPIHLPTNRSFRI